MSWGRVNPKCSPFPCHSDHPCGVPAFCKVKEPRKEPDWTVCNQLKIKPDPRKGWVSMEPTSSTVSGGSNRGFFGARQASWRLETLHCNFPEPVMVPLAEGSVTHQSQPCYLNSSISFFWA